MEISLPFQREVSFLRIREENDEKTVFYRGIGSL